MIIKAKIGDAVTGANPLGDKAGGEAFTTLSELGIAVGTGTGNDTNLFTVEVHGAV
jgi:hypothetical protein